MYQSNQLEERNTTFKVIIVQIQAQQIFPEGQEHKTPVIPAIWLSRKVKSFLSFAFYL